MEHLHNGYTLETPPGTFPLSTDSIVLADFIRLPKNATVLDLGSGCATLGLLLCAKDISCTVTGIELEERSHLAALENIKRNQLQDRVKSICNDLRLIPSLVGPGSYSTCVSNPPYFSGGIASNTVPLARRDDSCSLEALFTAAAWALCYGGSFFLVHKPEKLAQLVACASITHLEPKRLCLVRHRPKDKISLILLHCKKGAKPGLLWDELHLFEDNGTPTEHYKKIYHL